MCCLIPRQSISSSTVDVAPFPLYVSLIRDDGESNSVVDDKVERGVSGEGDSCSNG